MCVLCAALGHPSLHATTSAVGSMLPASPQAVVPTGYGPVTTVGSSGASGPDSLLAGRKWGAGAAGTAVTVEYSFPGNGAAWSRNYGNGEPSNGFAPLSTAQREAVRDALASWSEVANIRFLEVADTASDVGDLRFAVSGVPSTAWAYYPAAFPEAGDVWLGARGHGGSASYAEGSYNYHTLVHEIGHAIGLKHPHDLDMFGRGTTAPASSDWLGTSVMSYRSHPGDSLDGSYSNGFFPSGPMLHDIEAAQHLYGANTATRSGDTVYRWAAGERIFATIWDGGGNDTLDWSNQSAAAVIDLNAGSWSELGPAYSWDGGSTRDTLAIARNVTIENAKGGSGDDVIRGNAAANRLEGLGGDDELVGGGGADEILGGSGTDRLQGGEGGDSFIGQAAELDGDWLLDFLAGDAIVVTDRRFTTADIGREVASGNTRLLIDTDDRSGADLLLNLAGLFDGSFAAAASGSLATRITLGSGIGPMATIGTSRGERLDGTAGADRIEARDGNDRVYGLNGNDALFGEGGSDRLYGAAGDDSLEGGDGRDTADGGSGDDLLRGGTGNDVLKGGSGTDTAVYDGDRSGFSIARSGSAWRVTDSFRGDGSEGTDTLRAVELLQFDDGLFSLAGRSAKPVAAAAMPAQELDPLLAVETPIG